ncbi:nuclear transport factor 2 family protein [Xanthomonas campestris]|uniref:nuclear transport factor 2 family protein n=1 Tax=Xanthomonas campestris TaxID=339 RepID=UPI000CDAD67D|nr:nuclear transport factor 2 family protein [Xanthomonas campestris]TXD45293.1 nuclear transport factor 2 family protein [Xanthomonas campestris]
MSLALPHAIACFFAASNTGDAAVLLPHLADDAVVHDERHHHRGAAAIAAWLAQTQATTPYRAVPLGVHIESEQVRVTAQVSGEFSQSPLQLEHLFHLVGGKIAALEIH